MRGLIDADLGGDIIKQRVARPGQGKRSGFRMLIGIRPGHRPVWLRQERARQHRDDQLGTLREIVASWFAADEKKITHAVNDGFLIEVHDGKEN